MKKFLKISLVAMFATILLTGCNCFKAASKRVDALSVNTNPSPVSLKGDVVPFTAEVSIPAKFVKNTATYKITPVFIYEGGELAAEPYFVQGEKAVGNYQTILTTGGVAKINSKVTYEKNIRVSKLVMRIEVQCKKGQSFLPLADIPAAKGVSIIQNLVKAPKFAFAKDNFQRVTTEVEEANILFRINSSVVRKAELNNEEVKALQQFILDNRENPRRTVSDVHTKSYASPDGPVKFNDKLSQNRSKATQKSVNKEFAKKNINNLLDFDALGEDWDGFKALVEKSDIAEKDMILQILNMYNDPAKRDEEIKNLSSVFTILKEKVLPQLRRSKMEVSVEIQGYTDEELKEIVHSNVKKLNVEEMLFAATLFEDIDTKAKVYAAAAEKYSQDWRTINNNAIALYTKGNVAEAKAQFAKAAQLNSSAAEVVNNLGAVAFRDNKIAEAKNYFSSVAGQLNTAKENLGLVYLRQGEYAEAIKYCHAGSEKGIAQILSGDLAGAKQTVKGHTCMYAKAVEALVIAKEGDFKTAEELAAKCGALKDEIMIEINLMK